MKLKNGIKVNVFKILVYLIILSVLVGGSLFLASCSDSKLIEYHLKKAEKHGGKISCDTIYIDVPKLVKGKDGRDSLIYVPTPIPCAPCQPCEEKESRFEIKWKYKYDLRRQKARDEFLIDSLDKEHKKSIKLSKIEGKTAKTESKSTAKIETANNKSLNLGLIVFGILGSLVLLLLILYKIKRK